MIKTSKNIIKTSKNIIEGQFELLNWLPGEAPGEAPVQVRPRMRPRVRPQVGAFGALISICFAIFYSL